MSAIVSQLIVIVAVSQQFGDKIYKIYSDGLYTSPIFCGCTIKTLYTLLRHPGW